MAKFIERSEEVTRQADALWDLFCARGHGEVVAWRDICAAIGANRRTPRVRTVVEKLKVRLLNDRSIVIRPITNVGYRLLPHKEANIRVVQERMDRAKRQLNRGSKELATVDMSELTDHERRLHAINTTVLHEQQRVLRKARREHAAGAVPETMPR